MTTDIRCHDLEAVLSAYVDHEATPDESARVEQHVRTCTRCANRLRRWQESSPRLDQYIRAAALRGEPAVERALRRRRKPLLMQQNEPSGRLIGRFATVGIVALLGAVLVLTLLRTAPETQPLQTAAQATQQTLATDGRFLVVEINGVVDPAVATYVQRTMRIAGERGADGVVVVLDASAGLDSAMQHTREALQQSPIPIIAYAKQHNATTSALAQATPNVVDTDPGIQKGEMLPMEPLEAVWHRLFDPSVAYVLFVLGLYALFAEVAHPGAIAPGLTGIVTLVLSIIAFANLPINLLGVAVLLASVVLMGVEVKAPRHGLLTLAGTAGLVAGSRLLYAAPGSLSPMVTDVSVAPAVLGATIVLGAALGVLFARVARRIRALPPVISFEQLIGARGLSRSGLDPSGVVHVQGQLWSARARGPHIEPGESVRVLARHGLVLEVESAGRRSAATQKGAIE